MNPWRKRSIYELTQPPGSIPASQWLSFSRLMLQSAKVETLPKSTDMLKLNSFMGFWSVLLKHEYNSVTLQGKWKNSSKNHKLLPFGYCFTVVFIKWNSSDASYIFQGLFLVTFRLHSQAMLWLQLYEVQT